MPRVLLLENVRSLQNVGSMFRTADGAGWDRLVLCGYTPTPPRQEISKTALGAETWIPWEYWESAETAVAEYRAKGYAAAALELATGARDLLSLDPSEFPSLLLAVGNETEGVSPGLLAACGSAFKLPMLGKKESLNVSVAAAVAMYHFPPCNVSC